MTFAANVWTRFPPAALSRWDRRAAQTTPRLQNCWLTCNGLAGSDTSNRADASDSDESAYLDPPRGLGYIGSIDTYDVKEVIGRGGMGIVFKAYDRSLKRFVAIKVLAPTLASLPTARQRFTREAHAAAAISDHDHVVTIHAVGEHRGLPFLVMQWIKGESLDERIQRDAPVDFKDTARIGRQIARALAFAHREGLIHRDVKPANILLENGVSRVKLTDFGLARALDDSGITRTGTISGTLEFMSPEQARDERIDQRADLYALGAVLYAMCTGRPPFRGNTPIGLLRKVCEETPQPLTKINEDTPAWIEQIVNRLLQKDPSDRFQSAEEVEEALTTAADNVLQPAQASGTPTAVRSTPLGRLLRLSTGRAGCFVQITLCTLLVCLAAPYFVDIWSRYYPRLSVVSTADELDEAVARAEGKHTAIAEQFSLERQIEFGSTIVRLRPAQGATGEITLHNLQSSLQTNATLVLEGLTIRQREVSNSGDNALIRCRTPAARLYALNCRFVTDSETTSCIELIDGASGAFRNCMFVLRIVTPSPSDANRK